MRSAECAAQGLIHALARPLIADILASGLFRHESHT